MKIEEIREIFKKEGKQGYADKENTIPIYTYHCRVVDVIVHMDNCKITILCGEDDIMVDCNSSHENSLIDIDGTLIEPIKNIKDIEVSWR